MEYAKLIDHTLLKTEATEADIAKLVEEARKYEFASVCISPIWVAYAAKALKDTSVNVCTVIGFPQGATPTTIKVFETKTAIEDGASEVDMVIAVGKLKSGDSMYVKQDIAAVVKESRGKAKVKVIIEACLLTNEEKALACQLALEAGADFVKTSTGFSTGGAVKDDVRLMRRVVGDKIGVKAAGGIRSEEDVKLMLEAGANRIGTSNGVNIVQKSLVAGK
ncbi:deoxyribose-phosphate aldolase [Anaerosinus massiliensis]|uniref:deoxyribose-phosphate aldolase n=1 Tax=Massilibacillus massiliensis TaxID=1806837 RepID=UPI000B2428DA|nr:deoxyribose-phosphate aldolase [Massilibacillus massiliensis]